MPPTGLLEKLSNLKNSTALLLLFFVSFILYFNTINHKYNIDDTFVSAGDPSVKKGLYGLKEIFTTPYSNIESFVYGYRPMAKATYAVEYHLWKENPKNSHIINIILYALNLFVAFIFLKLIFKRQKSYILWFIILLFASHPIHTEVVSSLKNREELLSFLFGIISLIAFLKLYENRNWWWLPLALFSLFLSLLSKQTGIIFFILSPLCIVFLSDFKLTEFYKLFKVNSLYFILSISLWFVAAWLRLIVYETQHSFNFDWLVIILHTISVILLVVWRLKNTLKEKSTKRKLLDIPNLLLIGLSLVFLLTIRFSNIYVQVFYILILIPIANFNIENVNINIKNLKKEKFIGLISFLLLIVVSAMAIIFAQRGIEKTVVMEEVSRNYFWENPLFMGADFNSTFLMGLYSLFYYVRLLFVPHPLRFYYGYATLDIPQLANIGLWLGFFLMIFILFSAFKTFKDRKIYSFGIMFFLISIFPFLNFIWAVAGIVAERLSYVASLGFAIFLVGIIFEISEKHPQKLKKNSVFVILTLIILVFSTMTISRNRAWKDPDTLFATDISKLDNSLKANDIYASLLHRKAEVLISNRGNTSEIKKNLDLSLHHYQKVVEIYPPHIQGWNNLGIMQMRYFNKFDEAIRCFQRALSYDSNFVNSYINIGNILLHTAQYAEAKENYYRLMEIDSTNLDGISGYVQSLLALNDTMEAKHWNEKIRDEFGQEEIYYINIANFYMRQKDSVAAMNYYENAFEVNKNNIELSVLLGQYFSRKGLHEKAGYYHQMSTQIQNNANMR